MSHIVITDVMKSGSPIDIMHNMGHSQRSFMREWVNQSLGSKPSKYWGEQPVPIEFPSHIDHKTKRYLSKVLSHAPHVGSQLLLENHRAAAGFSSMAAKAAEWGEKAVEYGVKGAKFVAKHLDKIKKLADAASTGIGLAEQAGLISSDSALAQGNDLYASIAGLTASGFYKRRLN